MRKNAWLAALAVVIALSASAEELHVPSRYPTIQAAVTASKDGDHVVVPPGTYRDPIDLLGRHITLRSSGGADVTILDGSGYAKSILTANNGESAGDTIVRGFTFRNGYGTDSIVCGLEGRKGGAIHLLHAGISVLDSVFEDNGDAADVIGGAIYACEADLAIVASRFERNAGSAGGIDYEGWPTRRLTIEHTTFRANRGGAVYAALFSNSSLTIKGSQFHDNESPHGAGISVYGGHSSRTTIERSTFVNNLAGGTGGGTRISLANRATLTLTGCRFDGNRASHGAGMNIATSQESRATISDCDLAHGVSSFGAGAHLAASNTSAIDVSHLDFRDHEASFGGGVFAAASGGRITISNSRFFDNVAHPRPGTGIYLNACFIDGRAPAGNGKYFGGGADLRTIDSGTITVASSLFAGNSSFSGGGGASASSCQGGTIELVNTTIVGNESGVHARLTGTAQINVVNSIVRDNTGDEITGASSVTYTNVQGGFAGEGNMDLDPRFVDAAARDYRLSEGSACIDAGDNTRVREPFRTDVTGRSRFIDDLGTRDTGRGEGALVDLGAYEYQPGRRRTVRR